MPIVHIEKGKEAIVSVTTIGSQYATCNNRNMVYGKKKGSRDVINDIDDKMLIDRLPYGRSPIKYKDTELIIQYTRLLPPFDCQSEPTCYKELYIECDKPIEFIKEFITHCIVEFEKIYMNKKKLTDKIEVLIWDDSYWDNFYKLHKRSIESISLDNEANKVLDGLKRFLSEDTQEKYMKLGIRHKKNLLFEGLPGTGKTSLIYALASELNMNVAIIHFDRELTDLKLMKAVQRIPENTILVLEDMDHLFQERKKNDDLKNSISFSGILNTLDGFGSQVNLITILTTNYKTVLDKALYRPGRIDQVVHFDYATESQIRDMFIRFLPEKEDTFPIFYKEIKRLKITTAILQQYLFQNMDCEDIMENIEEFKKLVNDNNYSESGTELYS